ncbi:cytochrome P450 [Streptomyces sp. NPDC007325]|uniref:cytochrome P450 n=1 Tax=Streptomyces sp. NPDC007325 TaxID=3154588 RepID=UPI0033CB608D
MSHEHVSYLELLARGAATEAYDRPVLLARASGAGPETLAGLEEAKQLALRVRAELEGRRRREAELSALFATAHDLAGLRDLDAVLRAIVQRARALLGTEVAYLSLNDPAAGDTYMRVTEGSVSARFQQLRLGMGEGLGGLVAQTARPYVTDDYFDDERFQHTRTIDTAVRDEGLVAILGVPLTLGSQVIGVLFAADRRARVFEREQVALLGSFAAHAAVAIDTANLLAETRSALAELERANDIIRAHSAGIERAAEVHDRLSELVLRGGGVHDVTEAVSEVLGGTVEFTETTAGAVCWALYQAARTPEAGRRLAEECRPLLGTRAAGWDDLPHLPYTRQVLLEATRLNPPGWLVTRTATTDARLGAHHVPAGATLAYSPYLLAHLPGQYPDPDRFDPDRWAPGRQATDGPGRQIPASVFGGGARQCVGQDYALAEGVLMLASITARWKLRIDPEGPRQPRLPGLTLNPLRLHVTLAPTAPRP